MSAFECTDSHLRYMLAAKRRFTPINYRTPDEHVIETWEGYGVMLRNANTASLTHRYPDLREKPPTTSDDPKGGEWINVPVTTFVINWNELDNRPVTLAGAMMALDCFEYQACEPPTWEQSPAYEWCRQLRRTLCRAVPGYDDADTWGIDWAEPWPDTVISLLGMIDKIERRKR